ncbi:hypothetical protein TGPRC2_306455 [Toxoplasma gondii TgCatPRC2]|uniref:Transmembrane protein n=3 Tax=Toxoplasma gondii TaxID=5811 RepID=A0A151H483_TOXGO|nr:hypothetical protein TGME49_306455 [Toxoplasma gondii ME49]EPT27470.1 hypothetical protein TGME49_306455 [Toxoplasma gondii ME49]KYF44676.1 hypothetical protein TGARI_306455 [Toxoplasma gondii ARI]KYK64178.1 hypothetical protein TGPRC2_306455 [Toxoplasma gondii TgCatPRC2]|eukprot:XP_018636176.1 hypothetical protein TGME49_306455 [Toxoplasma gondii ME49]
MKLGRLVLLVLSFLALSLFSSEDGSVQVAEAVRIFGRKKKKDGQKGEKDNKEEKKEKKKQKKKKRDYFEETGDGRTPVDRVFEE